MIQLDQTADTFPVGLAGTPFEDVYRALRVVAATVWSVDPTVYRAGMAWGWYALHDPAALIGFRDVVTAALISVVAPMVKDTQTDAELVEYLRQWRSYTPTFPKLQALFALFGADVDIQPISDPESQRILPVDDTRLAFYIRIESVDFSRPLSLSEAREIAVRATPLGSRPYPYYALETRIACPVSPAPAGIYIWLENWEIARPPAPPQQLGEFILVDATGSVVHGVEQLNEMVFTPTGYFTIEDTSDVVFVEQSPYPIVSHFHVNFDTVQTLTDGAYIDTVLPYYSSKLYIAGTVNRVAGTVVDYGLTVSNEGGCVRVTNNTGASVTLTQLAIQSMDAAGSEVVEVVDGQDNHAWAFKWDDDGTPYWWISYSGERHWTDTLGNWSEVPSVVLPTVSVKNDFGSYNWLYSQPGQATYANVSAGDSREMYYSGLTVSFDSSKSYAVLKWFTTDITPEYTGTNGDFSVVNSSGHIAVKNDSGSAKNIFQARVAVCSSNQATVVTVYNSSNVAYNAFKYITNGTDYYYVLDGVQTDWTDDLSSIGYRIVLLHDDATGTISSITLPTAHSGSYTCVSFDSLRYYVKGTVSDTGSETKYLYGYSDTWHYGTVTWTDESVGDLSDKISVNPPTSSGLVSQTVLKIIFITNGISGYLPRDAANLNRGQISQYTYNNGVHTITFYTNEIRWYEYPDAGRIQFRYLDGSTTFNNLDAFDLVTVSSGTLSKATTTDRYDMYNTWNGDITVHAKY